MNKLIIKIYQNLPLQYREYYRFVRKNYRRLTMQLKFMVLRPFIVNKKMGNINVFEHKIYSQNGEDGIIKAIFTKIGTTNKFCVEFGVGDGKECNTRYLIERER